MSLRITWTCSTCPAEESTEHDHLHTTVLKIKMPDGWSQFAHGVAGDMKHFDLCDDCTVTIRKAMGIGDEQGRLV